MRRHFRALALIGALAAMSIPAFNVTHKAAACAPSSCVVRIVGGSVYDQYISPLTATLGTVNFGERGTIAQLPATQTVTVTGFLGFTVYDLRGNNQGFSTYIQCANPCLTSPQFPPGVPAGAFSVAGPVQDDVALLLGDGTGDEGGDFVANPTGASLASPVLVGGECQFPIIGESAYIANLPVRMVLGGTVAGGLPLNEILTLPISFDGNFILTVVENQPPNGCVARGQYINAQGQLADD